MITKDESLSVVIDPLNQVLRHCRTEKLLSHLHDVTGRVAASFNNTEKFEYIPLLHFFNNDAIVFSHNFSSQSSHSHFHDDSSM